MGKGGGGGGKKGGDQPAAPDYRGAAQETSQGSIQAAIINNLMNLRDTYTPLGSQTFEQTGSYNVPGFGNQPGYQIPRYQQAINMTPEGRGLYDQQMGLSKGLLGLGQHALNQTSASLGNPIDSTVDQVADRSYGLQTGRLDKQWKRNREAFDAKLADQGIAIGHEAYKNAQDDFGQQENDAYERARLSSIGTMPQTYQLATAQRMQPLSELNAIRSGAQPQMPQFQAVPAAGGAQGPNMLGATNMQGQWDQGQANMQAGQQNSKKSSMGAIAGAAAMFF